MDPEDDFVDSHLQHSLSSELTVKDIEKALGPKIGRAVSDPDKVKYQWDFLADGQKCSIWDYKRARWSAFGPRYVFDALGLTVVS